MQQILQQQTQAHQQQLLQLQAQQQAAQQAQAQQGRADPAQAPNGAALSARPSQDGADLLLAAGHAVLPCFGRAPRAGSCARRAQAAPKGRTARTARSQHTRAPAVHGVPASPTLLGCSAHGGKPSGALGPTAEGTARRPCRRDAGAAGEAPMQAFSAGPAPLAAYRPTTDQLEKLTKHVQRQHELGGGDLMAWSGAALGGPPKGPLGVVPGQVGLPARAWQSHPHILPTAQRGPAQQRVCAAGKHVRVPVSDLAQVHCNCHTGDTLMGAGLLPTPALPSQAPG